MGAVCVVFDNVPALLLGELPELAQLIDWILAFVVRGHAAVECNLELFQFGLRFQSCRGPRERFSSGHVH